MAIESDAAPDEISSPFYIRNQELCLRWEKLFDDLNGKSNGKYTSWAYGLAAKIESRYLWQINISKSTYSASGEASTIIIESIELKANISNFEPFVIRKRNFFDFFKSNSYPLKVNQKYVLVGKPKNRKLLLYFLEYFQEPIKSNNLYDAIYENDELKISIHDYNDCFELIENLINEKRTRA